MGALIIYMLVLIHFSFYTIHSLGIHFLEKFLYIFPVYELFFHWYTIIYDLLLILLYTVYLCLNLYVCVFYTIYSLVVLNIGNFVLYLPYEQVVISLVNSGYKYETTDFKVKTFYQMSKLYKESFIKEPQI